MPTTTQTLTKRPSLENARHLEGVSSSSDFILDSAVLKEIGVGSGSTLVSAQRYGTSAWSSTARITVKKENGINHDYFLKIVKGEYAAERVLGEYSCMYELFKTMPTIVPTPRGSGKCVDSNSFWYLCDYLDITHQMPDAERLGQKVAELHRSSVSPTGKFGFHVMPYDGKLPLVADWDSSWTSFYRKLLAGVYELDVKVNGFWKELDDAMTITFERVIPRLLGVLEEDGRSVKPCLIHGDLWEENIGTDPNGEIYIFDSCAYYAHHEMGVGMWRVDHHHMKAKKYRDEYFQNFEPDEPMEEHDDRNRLYSVKERIMYSAHVPGTAARAQALEDLQYLIERYAQEDED